MSGVAQSTKQNKWRRLSAILLLMLFIGGCGHTGQYLGFWQRQHELKTTFEREPKAELLAQLDPENCYLLIGKLSFDRDPRGPVLIVAVTDKFKDREIAVKTIMQTPLDYYQAYLPEGRYELYFFADLNGDGYFDADEVVARTPENQTVLVSKAAVKDGLTVMGPAFSTNLAKPTRIDLAIHVQVKQHSYVYESLDDDFFDPRYGQLGLYDVKTFMAHTQQYIFSFEELNENKTHIVFVHGVGGTPRDFKHLVEGLDRKHYQPWFYFYPSGMPLRKLGSNLADIIKHSTNTNRGYTKKQRLIIVAHSMGGLVSLSALNDLCRDGVPDYIKGYISFNSPYGGVDSAAAGLKYAPAVVPAWRDVATGSPFLMWLYSGNAVKEVPFYLFFGYKNGESGDGTITLQSQLARKVHLAAHKTYGFNASHVGILNDEEVRQVFREVLESLKGQK